MGAGGVNRSSSSARMDLAEIAVVSRSLGASTSTLLLRTPTGHPMSEMWLADVGAGHSEGGEGRE